MNYRLWHGTAYSLAIEPYSHIVCISNAYTPENDCGNCLDEHCSGWCQQAPQKHDRHFEESHDSKTWENKTERRGHFIAFGRSTWPPKIESARIISYSYSHHCLCTDSLKSQWLQNRLSLSFCIMRCQSRSYESYSHTIHRCIQCMMTCFLTFKRPRLLLRERFFFRLLLDEPRYIRTKITRLASFHLSKSHRSWDMSSNSP